MIESQGVIFAQAMQGPVYVTPSARIFRKAVEDLNQNSGGRIERAADSQVAIAAAGCPQARSGVAAGHRDFAD